MRGVLMMKAYVFLALILVGCGSTSGIDIGSFTVAAGEQGKINLTINLPADTTKYKSISIYRQQGETFPACGEGALAYEITDFTNTPVIKTDSGLSPGGIYSYRACIDTSSDGVVSVAASTEAGHVIPQLLVSFTVTSGGVGSPINSVNVDFPADVSGYKSVSIYRNSGQTAPDCGEGTFVITLTGFTPDPISIPNTGTVGVQYSYTACIESTSGYIVSMTAYVETGT